MLTNLSRIGPKSKTPVVSILNLFRYRLLNYNVIFQTSSRVRRMIGTIGAHSEHRRGITGSICILKKPTKLLRDLHYLISTLNEQFIFLQAGLWPDCLALFPVGLRPTRRSHFFGLSAMARPILADFTILSERL